MSLADNVVHANRGACNAANAASASDFVRRCTENTTVKYAISRA